MSNLIKIENFKMKDFFLSKWKINWNWHDSIQECFSSDEKKITLKISLIYWCLFRNYFNEYLFKALWFSRNCKFLGNACRVHIMLCTSHICKHCFVILYLAFKTKQAVILFKLLYSCCYVAQFDEKKINKKKVRYNCYVLTCVRRQWNC